MSSPTNNHRPPYTGEPGPVVPPSEPVTYDTSWGAPADAAADRRPDAQPSGTLLLREVPVHAGAPGAEIIGPALRRALRGAPAARCRLYVLTDLARPSAAAPLAAALLETGAPGRDRRWALLHTLVVATPYQELRHREQGHREQGHDGPGDGEQGHEEQGHGEGLGRRLLDDLLMELRADGVRLVWFRTGPGDGGVRGLLESAGFGPLPSGMERTYGYDEPEIRPWAAWLVREL